MIEVLEGYLGFAKILFFNWPFIVFNKQISTLGPLISGNFRFRLTSTYRVPVSRSIPSQS